MQSLIDAMGRTQTDLSTPASSQTFKDDDEDQRARGHEGNGQELAFSGDETDTEEEDHDPIVAEDNEDLYDEDDELGFTERKLPEHACRYCGIHDPACVV